MDRTATWRISSTEHRHQQQEEEDRLCLRRYEYHFALIFTLCWLFYCWSLPDDWWGCHGDQIALNVVIQLLFTLLHVLVGWKCYEYGIRLRRVFAEYSLFIALSGVSFALLIFIRQYKPFLRQAFAVVD